MYRPQFVYAPVAGEWDLIRCQYSFDQSNVPVLAAGTVAAGFDSNLRIPLVLDQDADFLLREIRVSPTLLGIGIVDPHNNALVDPGQGPNVNNLGLPPSLYSFVWSHSNGSLGVTLEGDGWGIFCPAGSSLGLYINNWTGLQQVAPVINVHGVKRYPHGGC